jgi:Putative heavy-metal chelation
MTSHILDRTRTMFRSLAREAGLLETDVSVLARPLTPEEAIGTPGRRDYPILTGRERVVEAVVGEGRGHAFTDTAREFVGRLSEVIELPFADNGARAIHVAAMNATLGHLGRVTGTVHCRDDDPESCGASIAETLVGRFGPGGVIGLIGLNPAIAEHLVARFGPENVRISDLDPKNIGTRRFGVEVIDGGTGTEDLVAMVDAVLVSGTTLVNGTYDGIQELVEAHGKIVILYGVTAIGPAEFLGLERLCPYGR